MRALISNYSRVLVVALTLILSTSTVWGQSTGDSFIDAAINGYSIKFGGNDTPNGLNPSQYTNGVDKCSSSQAIAGEINCPSDLFYTPNPHTGGYQAWGVGLTLIEGSQSNYYYCYAYYDEIYPDYYEWTFDCEIIVEIVIAHTLGRAVGRIEFGENTTSTSSWGSKPMSTLAFKANNVYTPVDSNVACDPETPSIFNGGAALCDDADDNVYAVPDVGYEDKVLIEDKNCNMPLEPPILNRRVGDHSDVVFNCFTHYDQA
ncbi:MAG: hypothetical protein WDZ76_14725 [Pseudohongiellaceae bacterium]